MGKKVRLDSGIIQINPYCGEKLPSQFYYIDLEAVCAGELTKDVIVARDEAPSRAQRLLKANDILFQTVRPYQQNNYFFRKERELRTVASTGYAQIRTDNNAAYLYYSLHQNDFVREVNNKCTGSNYPAINPTELGKCSIFFEPDKVKQDNIAAVLTTADEAILASRALVEKYTAMKQGLMQDLLGTGEMVQLGVVADSFQYGLNSAGMQFDGENKYLRITDIDEVTRRFLSTNITSPSGKLTDAFLLSENDIVFARTGASVGKTYIYDPNDGAVYFAGFLVRCRVKPTYCAKYIFFQTLTDDYKRWVSINSQRSGQPGVNAEQYKKYEFKCPPLPEQKRIAKILTAADERLTAERERLVKLENIKRGLMDDLLTNRVSTDTLEGGREYA